MRILKTSFLLRCECDNMGNKLACIVLVYQSLKIIGVLALLFFIDWRLDPFENGHFVVFFTMTARYG